MLHIELKFYTFAVLVKMSTSQNPKPVLMRRARKSIANLPSPDTSLDKENTEHGTASTNGGTKLASKKGRSKSLGPGGLEALTEDAGNRQKVEHTLIERCIFAKANYGSNSSLPLFDLSLSRPYRYLHPSKFRLILMHAKGVRGRQEVASRLQRQDLRIQAMSVDRMGL